MTLLSTLLRNSNAFHVSACAARRVSNRRPFSALSSVNYFLMKSEPNEYSIDDLIEQQHPEHWDGVRNYEARNIMKSMKVGDLAFFYHSNCKPSPGIVGTVKIAKEAYDDHFALDKEDKHYDPKSTAEKNRWQMVDVDIVEKFDEMLTLKELKDRAKDGDELISSMALLNRMRLSVTKVNKEQWNHLHTIIRKVK